MASLLAGVGQLTQLAKLWGSYHRVIICGDFNCPGAGDRHLDVNLKDLLQRYDMTQHVAEATRGDNILDLLVTSASDNDNAV